MFTQTSRHVFSSRFLRKLAAVTALILSIVPRGVIDVTLNYTLNRLHQTCQGKGAKSKEWIQDSR